MTSVHIPGWELQESNEEVLKKKKWKKPLIDPLWPLEPQEKVVLAFALLNID